MHPALPIIAMLGGFQMGRKIKTEFNGTGEAELAAIQLHEAGIPLLSRGVEPVYVEDVQERTAQADHMPPIGSYRTLFSAEPQDAVPHDAGGSVLLTVEVDGLHIDQTERILRNNRGMKIKRL